MRMRCIHTALVLVALACASHACTIPKLRNNVCGTNGRSFVNLQALQCFNRANPLAVVVRTAYMGRCIQPEISECNYSPRSRPVCGDDGLTYLNAAMVACRNRLGPKRLVAIAKRGPC